LPELEGIALKIAKPKDGLIESAISAVSAKKKPGAAPFYRY